MQFDGPYQLEKKKTDEMANIPKMNAIHSWCLRTLNVAFQMNALVFTLEHLLSLVIFRRSVSGRTKTSPTETLQTTGL